MGYVPAPPPPSKEEFLKNPEFYWNELRRDQNKQLKMDLIRIGTLGFGLIGVICFIVLIAIKSL